MAEAVSRRAVTMEARLRSQVSPNENCGGQTGTGSGLSTSVFPCQLLHPWELVGSLDTPSG